MRADYCCRYYENNIEEDVCNGERHCYAVIALAYSEENTMSHATTISRRASFGWLAGNNEGLLTKMVNTAALRYAIVITRRSHQYWLFTPLADGALDALIARCYGERESRVS